MGLRGQYLVRRITLVRGWSACLSRRLVHILCKSRSVFRATGRPSSCAFEGRYAPRSPRHPHQRRATVPTTATRRRTRAETTRRAPTFKTIGVEGRAEPPTEPRVNTEIRRPTRAAELEPKHVLVAIQCRPQPQVHATGCNSMQDRPASKTPPVGLHPAAQVRPCSLSEETKAPTATATRASCHKARHDRRGLPHPRRRISSGGALLSSAVYEVDSCVQSMALYPAHRPVTSRHKLTQGSLPTHTFRRQQLLVPRRRPAYPHDSITCILSGW